MYAKCAARVGRGQCELASRFWATKLTNAHPLVFVTEHDKDGSDPLFRKDTIRALQQRIQEQMHSHSMR